MAKMTKDERALAQMLADDITRWVIAVGRAIVSGENGYPQEARNAASAIVDSVDALSEKSE